MKLFPLLYEILPCCPCVKARVSKVSRLIRRGDFFPWKKVDRIRPRPHSFSEKNGKYRDFYFSFGKKRVLFCAPPPSALPASIQKVLWETRLGKGRKKRGKTDDVWLFNGQAGPKAKKNPTSLLPWGSRKKRKEKWFPKKRKKVAKSTEIAQRHKFLNQIFFQAKT